MFFLRIGTYNRYCTNYKTCYNLILNTDSDYNLTGKLGFFYLYYFVGTYGPTVDRYKKNNRSHAIFVVWKLKMYDL